MKTDNASTSTRLDRLVSQFLHDSLELIDAFGCPAGWEFEDEVEPAITTVKTIGFLMKETDEFFFVVPHFSTTNGRKQFAGHLAVPKLQVLKSVRLTSFSYLDAE